MSELEVGGMRQEEAVSFTAASLIKIITNNL